MPNYRIQEAEFDLPPNLHDKTVSIFSSSDTGKSEFNIVISKDALKGATDLSKYVEHQIGEMKENFPDFELLRKLNTNIGTAKAVALDYKWKSEKARLFQRQYVMIVHPPTGAAPYALMVTATGAETLGKWEETFTNFMRNFSLRW